jgi:hypothetical protein
MERPQLAGPTSSFRRGVLQSLSTAVFGMAARITTSALGRGTNSGQASWPRTSAGIMPKPNSLRQPVGGFVESGSMRSLRLSILSSTSFELQSLTPRGSPWYRGGSYAQWKQTQVATWSAVTFVSSETCSENESSPRKGVLGSGVESPKSDRSHPRPAPAQLLGLRSATYSLQPVRQARIVSCRSLRAPSVLNRSSLRMNLRGLDPAGNFPNNAMVSTALARTRRRRRLLIAVWKQPTVAAARPYWRRGRAFFQDDVCVEQRFRDVCPLRGPSF